MNERLRVAVIGGGVAGPSTARELALLGCRHVTLLERGLLIGASSGLSAGVFTRQYVEPLDVELRVYGLRHVLELERQGHLTFRPIGYARLAHDDATVDAFEDGLRVQRALGVDDARILSPGELGALVPGIRTDDLTGALYSPTDGYLDGHRLCQVFAEHAAELGVRIVQRAPVETVEGGRGEAFRLGTPAGVVEADVVVNAAGAWAGRVGDLLGAPVVTLPQREQVCLGRLPASVGTVLPFLMDYVPGDPAPGLWLRDEGHGQFIAGLHSNDLLEPPVPDPDDYPRAVEARFVEEVAERLLERFPGIDDIGLKEGWTGLYPFSADGRALVGPHPADERVVVAAGLGGVGIMLSPAVGRLAAEWIVHGEPRSVAGAEALLPSRLGVTAA